MYGYIYKTTNLVNNKIYIGQKKSNIFLGNRYLGSGKILKDAISKYGEENFKVELIEEVELKDDMDKREIFWISHYNATNRDVGYNVSEGGNVNRTMVGENNPFYGKHHTEETKAKFKNRKILKGRKHTPEELLKISLKNKGKIVSQETKQKLSNNAKINPNYGMKGKKVSNETREKLRQSKLGKSSKAKGKIHITNGITNKMVTKYEFENNYKKLGYKKGRTLSQKSLNEIKKGQLKRTMPNTKGYCWLNNGSKSTLVPKNKVDEFLSKGWVKGRIIV